MSIIKARYIKGLLIILGVIVVIESYIIYKIYNELKIKNIMISELKEYIVDISKLKWGIYDKNDKLISQFKRKEDAKTNMKEGYELVKQ